MNRVIKFRAWDEDRKAMIAANDIEAIWADGTVYFYDIAADERGEPEQVQATCKPKLMQFTGLLDKNGKETYFKDIAEDEHGQRFPIEWDYPLLARLQEIPFTVIGNIYENPELLTDKGV